MMVFIVFYFGEEFYENMDGFKKLLVFLEIWKLDVSFGVFRVLVKLYQELWLDDYLKVEMEIFLVIKFEVLKFVEEVCFVKQVLFFDQRLLLGLFDI